MGSVDRDRESRAGGWLAVALALGLAGAPLHAGSADPAAAPIGVSLVRIDASLGVALVRTPEGAIHRLGPGATIPGGSLRVARLYGDRIEVEPAASRSPRRERYWLSVGDADARAVSTRGPEGAGTFQVPGPAVFPGAAEGRR